MDDLWTVQMAWCGHILTGLCVTDGPNAGKTVSHSYKGKFISHP